MKISEKHENGATITVQGWGARKTVEAWRAAQNKPGTVDSEDEEPRVKGVDGGHSGPVHRYLEPSGDPWTRNRVTTALAFGFVANELNAHLVACSDKPCK